MFGLFRFALAMMVVYSHFKGAGLAGPVAVFSFYCLSGFLMTKVVNELYSDGLTGYFRYLCNRALRIYPGYYVAAVFAAVVLLLWPAEARTSAAWYMMPPNWVSTITIIGLEPRSPILLIPAWSLHVELIYYILIGAILGRSRLLTLLWFVCALAMPIFAILVRGASFDWLYFTPYGASVAFASGAMIYHFRERVPAFSPRLAVMASCLLIFVCFQMPFEVAAAGGLHFSIVITAAALTGLMNMSQRPWDSALGDLAYPVFLVHIPCRAAMRGLLDRSDVLADLAAIAATILLSSLIVAFVDRPVARIRARLRPSGFV